MILSAEQTFDKVYLDREHPSEFIDYLSYGIERELTTKMMNQLKDYKLYIIQMHEPKFIENLPESWYDQAAYKQDIECLEIVQCKNCRMVFPWCRKFRDELGGNGFCPYGAEIQIEQTEKSK